MQLLFIKFRSRFWARPPWSRIRGRRGYLLVALPLITLLNGCAGTVTQNSSTTTAYSLSGTISPATAGSGATVTLSGPTSASNTANSSGSYSFSGLVNGIYAVTPNRTGYFFSPSVQSVSIAGSDVSSINFTASQQASHSVQLNWHASTSKVTGHNVYRGATDGGPYTKVNGAVITALSYTDSSVSSATTYYYVTRAVDSSGVESADSNQASAKIP